MIEKQFKNVNPCKLQDELINSGLIAGSFITFDLGNDIAQIQFFKDVDMELVESIVAKHDKTPIPSAKTAIELNQDTINLLGQQLVQEKISRIQTETLLDDLGKELVTIKLGGM